MTGDHVRTKLSVAIIAKDAAEHIGNCLRSVQWADEIILLDGHSSDETRQIARQFRATVVEKGFESFPLERKHVLAHTTHDWVLSLDADMIVPSGLAREIQDLLTAGPAYDAYLVRCLNHFLGREIRHCSWFDYRFLRLFNKYKGHYDLSKKVLDPWIPTGTVGRLKHFLVHHQAESLEEYLKKITARYAPYTADEYLTMGIRVQRWNWPWFLMIRPVVVFLYKYLWKRGFLDGLPGLIICANSAILYYFTFSILWDRAQGKPQYRMERYLEER
jgi:glycosyltransferase involved in cell wall biosynthesis